MKSIYLKNGNAQDVFNDLKDNFEGKLTLNYDEYSLALNSDFANGNIKAITFPEGMTYIEFDIVFYDDVRLSMESFMTSPIFFAYCREGIIQHSFGESGDRKTLKKQCSGILKSTSGVNSVLHFEKNNTVKLYVIAMETNATMANEQNAELVKKLKNTFFNSKVDYLDISFQNFKIIDKVKELKELTQKGVARNLFINRILESILKIEIEQHIDGFSEIVQTINSFTVKRIDRIKSISNLVMDLSVEIFTTDLLLQKIGGFYIKLQKEFKQLSSRTVHDFLIFIRIERQRV